MMTVRLLRVGLLTALLMSSVGLGGCAEEKPPEVWAAIDKALAAGVSSGNYDWEKISQYTTENGLEVLQFTVESVDAENLDSMSGQLGEQRIGTHEGVITVDLPATATGKDGEIHMVHRFLDEGGWKYHDTLCVSVYGEDVGLWLSYMKDHPIRTRLHLLFN